jgi:hypothetical protein
MTIEREEAQRHTVPSHGSSAIGNDSCEQRSLHEQQPCQRVWNLCITGVIEFGHRLASPSLAAVRKYYRDYVRRTVFQTELSLTEHRVYFLESFLRRHSILSLGSLATRMERIAVSSAMNGSGGEQMRERRSVAEVSREMLLDGMNRSELAKLGGFVSRRPLTPHPSILSTISARISTDPTLDRLLV